MNFQHPATHFENESVALLDARAQANIYTTRQPGNPQTVEPQVVVCLSCGGTYARSPDGSIPCGH